MKIVQIDGIRGIVTTLFIGVCLAAGFIGFPGYVCMYLWNKYLVSAYMFPSLTLFQGILLWGIAAISYSILTRNSLAVSFIETPELSEEELNKIIRSARFGAKLPLMPKVIKRRNFDISKSSNSEKENGYISSPVNKSKDKEEIKDNEKYSNMK